MLMPSLTRDALAADDSWTEVLRVSTGCIMNGDQPLRYSDGEPFTEGTPEPEPEPKHEPKP